MGGCVARGGKGRVGHDHKAGGKGAAHCPWGHPKGATATAGPWGVEQAYTSGAVGAQRGAAIDRVRGTWLLAPPPPVVAAPV